MTKTTSQPTSNSVYSLTQLSEALRVAVAAIASNRLRSVLTVLGVLVGVAVVALVASLLEGAQKFVAREAETLGPAVIRFEKASFLDFIGDGQAFVEAVSKRPDITVDEYKALRLRLNDRFDIGAQINAALPVQRGNKSLNGVGVQGVTANVAALASLKLGSGRDLNEIDDEYRRPVCVIGSDVAEYLFADENPVGAFIKVGAATYEVIGVYASRGSAFGASQDAFIQLPLGTFTKVFGLRSRSITLLGKAREDTGITRDEAEETLRFELRKLRRLNYSDNDTFSVVTAKSIQAFAGRITAIVGFVLYPLTAIALAVGGIVVMNMMLASVTERTREIGIRKALGARRRDILAQFLIESSLLTLAGGACGTLITALLIKLIAQLSGLPVSLPLWALVAALVVSCTVGVVFGVVPARRAARLDPIEALRTE